MAIFSYDFQNAIRDVTPAMEVIRKNEPTLFSAAQVGNPVANRNAEWVDASLGITFVDVSAVSGLVLTVPDGTLFTAGMELSPTSTADNYIVASVDGNDVTVTKAVSGMASPISGSYEVSYGSVLEGSSSGNEISHAETVALNNTQIFRAEAALTRTAIGTNTYDNASAMETQVGAALYDVYHQINRALWKGYKQLGSKTTVGKLGGIYQFCSALQVDADGAAISTTLINSLLKLIKNAGGKPNTLVCNTSQISAISELYKNQIIVTQDESIRGVYVNKIRNPFDGTILTIITDDMCPTKDIWAFDSTKLEVCYLTNGALTDQDTTTPGYDGVRRTVLGELTVKFHNASQCFGSIRDLA